MRYSTTGSSTWRNAQPVYRSVADVGFSLGHNGNLTNTEELATELGMLPGVLTSDSELIGELLAREYTDTLRSDGRDLEFALEHVLPRLAGGVLPRVDGRSARVRCPRPSWVLPVGARPH